MKSEEFEFVLQLKAVISLSATKVTQILHFSLFTIHLLNKILIADALVVDDATDCLGKHIGNA